METGRALAGGLAAGAAVTAAAGVANASGFGTGAFIAVFGFSQDVSLVLLQPICVSEYRTQSFEGFQNIPVEVVCLSAIRVDDGLPGIISGLTNRKKGE